MPEESDVIKLGAPEEDPKATRWSAGPALPASSSTDAPPESPVADLPPGPTAVPDFRAPVEGRRFVFSAEPTMLDQAVEGWLSAPPAALQTPPDFVTAPADAAAPAGSELDAAVLLPLPAEARVEPEDPGPPGPFGGPVARDYRRAVADRLPAAVRLLMPPPVLPPEGMPHSNALESGRRRSQVELRLAIDRVRREALAAEARSAELRREAALARDQAYEARATWQWSAHQRAAAAEELATLTTAANTVAEEQRDLSEQGRRAMRDASAWDAWIGQLRHEAKRLADEGQQADADAARIRAEQGQGQADQLRAWLDRAEQRFRQLGSHLDELATQRDARLGASVELAARQQLMVDRYQRLGAEAQRMEREAVEQVTTAIIARLEARERLIDLVGLGPELSRWVNGSAVPLVREAGRHSVQGGASCGVGRRYDIPAGYRRPLMAEHLFLERSLPATDEGGFRAAPAPAREWLARLNGVGPHADQSRAQNCVDATLALFDTFVGGRPRVAVPRIVDAHRSGTTRLPLRGEPTGRHRLEDALEGNLQLLFVQTGAVQSRFETYQVHAAFDTIAEQLRQAGNGSFAVIVVGWHDGNSHTSAAVSHADAVHWIDAQLGTVAEVPVPAEWVGRIEVLMVDGSGRPAPVPGMPLSPWTTRKPSAAYAAAVDQPAPSGSPPPPRTEAAG